MRSFGKKFQQSYQNCILRVQVKSRGESFQKFIAVFHFFIHGQKELNFRWKIFHSPSKLSLTCRRQQLEKKISFSIKSKDYTCRGFSQSFSERLVKTAFYLFTAQLWAFDKVLTKIFYLKFLRTLGETLSDCGKKKLGGIDRNACLMCEGSFSLTKSFWKECFFL